MTHFRNPIGHHNESFIPTINSESLKKYIDYYIDSSREELLNFLENYAGCLKSHEPLKILYDDPSKLLKNIS